MDNQQAVLTFPSSRKADIITKVMEYVRNNNILDQGKIIIDDNYINALNISERSNSTLDNSVEWFEFFRLVVQIDNKNEFRITDRGREFFDYYNKYRKIDFDNIYYILLDTTMPYKVGCSYYLSDKKYRVFETMFKVFLNLEYLGYKLDSRKFDEVYYFKINNDNYKDYEKLSDLIIETNSYSHARPVMDYLFSVLELFGVLEKEQSCIYSLTERFKKVLRENLIMRNNNEIKLPILSIKPEYDKIPYNSDFIAFTLYEYLFNGSAMDKIEQKYYNTAARGFSAKEIIDFYRVNNKEFNKGMYSNANIGDVINKLLSQDDAAYKNIGNALLGKNKSNSNSVTSSMPKFKKELITVNGAINKIYYGTPGCGKSTAVSRDYEKDGNIVNRTTFHPEYSNSDFIGQIIPKLDGNNVIYEFKAGIFTDALLTAFKNPDKKNVLIIEEINRGNASAIFGDIFQLLDRDKDGFSIFPIENILIKEYLEKNGINIDNIYIPSNLWIIATMNSSDQNVFTLDTAFKRRWKMHRIPNVFSNDNELASMLIPGTNVTWKEFVITINNAIVEKNKIGLNSEDKQIGVYFVTENELVKEYDNSVEASEAFAEKVLLYIWEDIAKINPTEWFGSDCNTFEQLLDNYSKNHLDVFQGIKFSEKNSDSIEGINDSNE